MDDDLTRRGFLGFMSSVMAIAVLPFGELAPKACKWLQKKTTWKNIYEVGKDKEYSTIQDAMADIPHDIRGNGIHEVRVFGLTERK